VGGSLILIAPLAASGMCRAPDLFAAAAQPRHGEIKESAQLWRRVPSAGIEQMHRQLGAFMGLQQAPQRSAGNVVGGLIATLASPP
jgi:hypothetical protein